MTFGSIYYITRTFWGMGGLSPYTVCFFAPALDLDCVLYCECNMQYCNIELNFLQILDTQVAALSSQYHIEKRARHSVSGAGS